MQNSPDLKIAAEARDLAAAQSGDAYRRWVWLPNRLYQKLAMLSG